MSRVVKFVRGLRVALFGVPHRHRWEVIRAIQLVDSRQEAIGSRYIMRCTGCGELKQKDCR